MCATRLARRVSSSSRIYVLYGDCGMGGLLDKVLREEGNVERIPGPQCFSFFSGNETFAGASEDEISTFHLTDFFCRHFDRFVWQALGLDRRADMVDFELATTRRSSSCHSARTVRWRRKHERSRAGSGWSTSTGSVAMATSRWS